MNRNPNSNYRQFYCNDPLFYHKVIKQEEAPYNFKLFHFIQR